MEPLLPALRQGPEGPGAVLEAKQRLRQVRNRLVSWGGVGGMSQVSKSVTGVAGANGDARIYALDFHMDRGYYDKNPFGLAGAAGSLPELAGQRAAAQENACTLLMWYVTKLFQPDTGIARGGSGGRQDEPGPPSVCSGIQSSDPSDSPSAASTKVVEGNIMM